MQRALGHLTPRALSSSPTGSCISTTQKFPISALVTDARDCRDRASRGGVVPGGREHHDRRLSAAASRLAAAVRAVELAPLIAELERAIQRPARVPRSARTTVYTYNDGRLVEKRGAGHGDAVGSRELLLGGASHLDEISDRANRFAIHDHDRSKTRADVSVAITATTSASRSSTPTWSSTCPKWKPHSKSGMTAALKNLVGINGDKAYLPHFSTGAPSWGGDDTGRGRWIYWTRTRGANC